MLGVLRARAADAETSGGSEALKLLTTRFCALAPSALEKLRPQLLGSGHVPLYFATVAGIRQEPDREWLTRFWDATSQFGDGRLPDTYGRLRPLVRVNGRMVRGRWDQHPVVDSLRRAATFCRTLEGLLWIYGYKRPVNWVSVVLHYAHLDMKGLMVRFVKYSLLHMANKGRQQPLPDRPDWLEKGVSGLLVDYPCYRWMSRILIKDPGLGETLLLGVKRGCPSLDDATKQTELENFRKLMSTPHPSTDLLIEESERTAGEVFGTCCQTFDCLSEDMSFSNRGGCTHSGEAVPVVQGGIRGAVWRWAVNEGIAHRGESLGGMVYHPCLGVIERRTDMLEHSSRRIFRALLDLPRSGRTVCKIAVIYEPCKVRIITEGQWDRYSLAKPLQRALWRSLQAFPCFGLTGTPQSEDFINQYLNSRTVLGLLPEFSRNWFWKSADYKDATNAMSARLCRAVLKAATGPVYERIAKYVCGRHTIFFPEDSGLEPVEQERGQLMGSPLSFPLLCVVNAACVRLAYERRFGRTFRLMDLPALINGDDIVFPADQELLRIWRELIAQVPFEESKGKSYEDGRWLQINSRTYDIRGARRPDGTFFCFYARERSYVNFGILGGLKKGVVRQDDANLEELSKRVREQWDHLGGLSGRVWGRAAVIYVRSYLHFARRVYEMGLVPAPLWPWNPTEVGGLGWSGPVNYRIAQTYCSYRKIKESVDAYMNADLDAVGSWVPRERTCRRLDRVELDKRLHRAACLRCVC